MSENKKLLALGEILWDVFPDGKKLGGAVCNVAFIAKQFGIESHIVSAVGADEAGDEILQILKDASLSTDCIARLDGMPTGHVDVTLDDMGKPEYIIHENVAWDHIPAADDVLALAADADAIYFGSLAQRNSTSRGNIRKIISQQKIDGLRVFDINLRQNYYNKQMASDCFELCNVLKLNDEELPILADYYGLDGDMEYSIRRLMDKFSIDIVAYTQGAAGATLFDKAGSYSAGCEKVEVVDTVGAGDSFTAALIAGLMNGSDPKEVLEHANSVAAHVCQNAGGTVILPDELLA